MARIRTIKPEFWTDERLTECSMSARLLFIGLLNFSDDNGNQAYSAKRIKMQVFPADNIDTQPLLNELLAHGILIEYSVNDVKYLHIKGFKKHQLINRPSVSSIPLPNFIEHSLSAQPLLTDGEEGKGEEGKVIKTLVAIEASQPSCPHDKIIALYHEHLPVLPAVKVWNDKRKQALQARWRESESRQNLDYWKDLFIYVSASDFLCGRANTFQATLEWLVNSTNFVKVIEGNYENRKAAA